MKHVVIVASILAIALAGCATKTQTGAMAGSGIGAVVGAIAGQAIGGNTGATLAGAAIGAGVGGLAGGAIGKYMDNQEAAMRQALANERGASIQREQDVLAVTFKSDYMFATNSSALLGGAYDELDRVARVLNQYPQTTIRISGHTDSTGSAEYNQKLSERRAEAVKTALVGMGVNPARISTIGYGLTRPVADNKTEAGRQQNRRVEVRIIPQQAQG